MFINADSKSNQDLYDLKSNLRLSQDILRKKVNTLFKIPEDLIEQEIPRQISENLRLDLLCDENSDSDEDDEDDIQEFQVNLFSSDSKCAKSYLIQLDKTKMELILLDLSEDTQISYNVKGIATIEIKELENDKYVLIQMNQLNDDLKIKIQFQVFEEAQIFYDAMIKTKNKKENETKKSKIKEIIQGNQHMQKNYKRYSWLNDISIPILQRQSKNVSFKIINKTGNKGQNQIAEVNLDEQKINFYNKDGKLQYVVNINNVIKLEKDSNDDRRIHLILQKIVTKMIFQAVKDRIIFESMIFPIINQFYDTPFTQDQMIQDKHVKIKIYVTTWNLGNIEPSLDIQRDRSSFFYQMEQYDLIVLGLQECDPKLWLNKIQSHLKQHEIVTVVTMWHMMICVFTKKQYINLITNLEYGSKALGIGGVIGCLSYTFFPILHS